MTLQEIIEKLKDRNLKRVAQEIGLHYNTLYNIVKGQGKPSYQTMEKLNEYLK